MIFSPKSAKMGVENVKFGDFCGFFVIFDKKIGERDEPRKGRRECGF